jgi:Sec-independent protein translocase protein TatA
MKTSAKTIMKLHIILAILIFGISLFSEHRLPLLLLSLGNALAAAMQYINKEEPEERRNAPNLDERVYNKTSKTIK